jgi:ribosome-associated protein
MSEDTSDEFLPSEEKPSKSARKRHSDELQHLGEMLIELPLAELEALELPEILRDAVLLARRITKHGGLYRQKQYIGKIMRKIDPEPIRIALAARQEEQRISALKLHRLEHWRDRMLAEGPSAVDEFLAARNPQTRSTPRARLVALVARAREEREQQRPPAAARELFKLIREQLREDDPGSEPADE